MWPCSPMPTPAEQGDKVKLMTVHAAKGLEFPYVFLCGMNEGIFPSRKVRTLQAMEEERRLAFVALTRAEKGLYLSEADGRNFDGTPRYPSRFLLDIDRNLLAFTRPPEEGLIRAARDYIGRSQTYLPETDGEHGILRGAAGEAYSVRLRYGAGCGHGQGCSCGTVR